MRITSNAAFTTDFWRSRTRIRDADLFSAAVVDGPVVLAGLTGSDCGIVGLDSPQEVFVPQYEHTYGTFPWRQNSWRTRNQSQSVMFRPLYEITNEEYTVYFTKKN